ncbi:ATP-binding protein [Pirellulaceae bacterium SH501]
MPSIADYEKLGLFYLGKKYDLPNRALIPEYVNYDARDLVTHALCVGMTGSGKTGLCLSLLEEAVLDDIPIICVDPKGDLGNLLLAFPDLDPKSFEPWIDPSESKRQDKSIEEIAKATAERWKKGLFDWDQPLDRLRAYREKSDITIYTPGSEIGVPLTVLKSFDAPSEEMLQDEETYREKITSSASALLALMGMEADPLSSREHILISNILDHSWRRGLDLSIEDLIRNIQSPPVSRIGVLDLETFYPVGERSKLAMSLNNLLASPAFAGWLKGEALDIRDLLYRKDGKPRVSILSIAHLSDAERMFFVTIVLGELLSWMRAQPGTSSLRAIFYMDEVFGYFPPSAKPPSKPPMLTLLKQARAFGLGIVLATQNPVDLDYKGLANMGTWFLGRLQTQRDKDRVLDGLEGASAQQGGAFDRGEMEKALSSLGNRVFLMNNVHDDGPTIFQTRWALSFLRGPLSREQISSLMKDRKESRGSSADERSSLQSVAPDKGAGVRTGGRPIVPPPIEERFLDMTIIPKAGSRLVYRPGLYVDCSVHYVRASSGIDGWEDLQWIAPVGGSEAAEAVEDDVWSSVQKIVPGTVQLRSQPDESMVFAELPATFLNAKNFAKWDKSFRDYLFRHQQYVVYNCKVVKKTVGPKVTEAEARIDLAVATKEARDAAVEKLRSKFSDKIRSLQSRLLAAQQRLDREKQEAQSKKYEGYFNVGSSILGALLGRKLSSRANVSKAASAVKSIGRATAQQGDVMRAEETLEELLATKESLEREAEAAIEEVVSQYSPENLILESIEIPIRKGDTKIKLLAIVWVPWQIDEQGIATPLVRWSKA